MPEWSVESGPLDMGDWLTQVQPIMGDLTSTSHLWWNLILEESKKWYLAHQALGPMDTLTHQPSPSAELKDVKWSRLERRATSLLLSALPPSQREEIDSDENAVTPWHHCEVDGDLSTRRIK